MSAEQAAPRFRVGEVPPLAEGFTDRPDTARGIMDAVVPGSVMALVPGSTFAEGASNWLGACGKTQIAAAIAESLWGSGDIEALVWISATNGAAVLSGFVQASAAATGIEPTGAAESVAARFISWLAETSQLWLVVLDDLPETADLEGLWPEGPAGRVLVTSTQSAVASRRPGMQVIPIGFFRVRGALDCLTARLSGDPAQRRGAFDLIDGRGPGAGGAGAPARGGRGPARRHPGRGPAAAHDACGPRGGDRRGAPRPAPGPPGARGGEGAAGGGPRR